MQIERRIKITSPNPSEFPDDIKAILREHELAALADIPGTFTKLAKDCEIPSLQKLLKQLSSIDEPILVLNSAFEGFWDVWIDVGYLSMQFPPLEIPEELELPKPILNLYRTIGAFHEGSLDHELGIPSVDELCSMEDLGLLFDAKNKVAPAELIPFVFEDDVNILCATSDGVAYRYDSDSGKVSKLSDLTSELNSYFGRFVE